MIKFTKTPILPNSKSRIEILQNFLLGEKIWEDWENLFFHKNPNLCHFCHETLVLFFCVGFLELSHLTRDWAEKKMNVDTSWANAQNY